MTRLSLSLSPLAQPAAFSSPLPPLSLCRSHWPARKRLGAAAGSLAAPSSDLPPPAARSRGWSFPDTRTALRATLIFFRSVAESIWASMQANVVMPSARQIATTDPAHALRTARIPTSSRTPPVSGHILHMNEESSVHRNSHANCYTENSRINTTSTSDKQNP